MNWETGIDIHILKVKKCVSCLVISNLCDPMDCSPPGSSVHGILQARTLEWVAFPFSRGLPDPGFKAGSAALQAILYHLSYQGSHKYTPPCVKQ